MEKFTGKKVKATFNPKRTDDVRPELTPLIGKSTEFYYAWIMDDEDQFPNVWALASFDREFGYWVPEFDLDDITEL